MKHDFLKIARKLAERANERCYRSDGYEEDLRELILAALREARANALDSAAKRIREAYAENDLLSVDDLAEEVLKLKDSEGIA